MKFVILIWNLWLEHQALSSFSLPKLQKFGGKGNLPHIWSFMNILIKKIVCSGFYWWILKTSAPWCIQGHNQLLLSHLKPYKEVQSSTIASWVKLVLNMAGIDGSLYKAHSCRSAPYSKAKALGISLKVILKRGQWSGVSTWQSHCNKGIVNTRESSGFETVILSNALN